MSQNIQETAIQVQEKDKATTTEITNDFGSSEEEA